MSEPSSKENSLFEANLSVIQCIQSTSGVQNDKSISEEEFILYKLNELRRWQDSQMSNQLTRCELLKSEKHKLYELLGLSVTLSEAVDNVPEGNENERKVNADEEQIDENIVLNDTPDDLDGVHPLNDDDDDDENQEPQTNSHHPTKYSPPKTQNAIIQSFNFSSDVIDDYLVETEQHSDIPKRQFLKRGEGLKARFKISPDTFRLNNLPKYKFARKNTQARDAKKSRHSEKRHHHYQQQHQCESIQNNGPAGEGQRSDGSGKGLKTNAKSNNRKSSNGFSCAKPIDSLSLKPKRISFERKQSLDKDSIGDSKRQINVENAIEGAEKLLKQNSTGLSTPSTKLLFDTPIRIKLQAQQNEIGDLSEFERLENRIENIVQPTASRGSLFPPVTMAENRQQELTLKFQVGLNLHSPTSESPKIDPTPANQNFHSKNANDSESHGNADEPKHVRFAQHVANIADGEDNDTIASEVMSVNDFSNAVHTSSPMERSTESFQRFKEKLFDRKLKQKFIPQLSVAKQFELMDLNETDEDASIASSTNENITSQNAQQHVLPSNLKDLQAQRDQLQDRLQDLETEIQSFRHQNAELTKLIQEHELIRMQFEEERQLMEDQLNDERIKFEVYMHDERMKLLNERNDLDRRLKESQRPNRSERDEIIKLREQCVNHEKDLSARDQKHIAAQGRLRAQLRNVEKELKELQLEAENLHRENRKIDAENIRLRRQSNNKMLHEINRNIAKLAPLQIQIDNPNDAIEPKLVAKEVKSKKNGVKECSNKTAHKTVVAKVTSHHVPGASNRLRSKSVPNLQQTENPDYSSLTSSDVEAMQGWDDEDDDYDETVKENLPAVSKSNYLGKLSSTKKQNNVINKEISRTTEKSRASIDANESKDSSSSMKRIIENPDGSKDIWYPNGNLKKISSDGMFIRMLYYNKDIKETNVSEGTVKYYYAESNTWATSYIDGLEILEFANGQTEHRHKDGTVEVHFPNGSVRITSPYKEKTDGIAEEWKYPDGTNVIQKVNGDRLLLLPNGQREVHTNGHKRREYPDGTVKIVYPDGSQETRYSNGRVRLKDKDGKLIMDSETIFV